MTAVLGSLFFWFLVVIAAVCVVVAVIAVLDCLRTGQAEWDEFLEWERARRVTGRVDQ